MCGPGLGSEIIFGSVSNSVGHSCPRASTPTILHRGKASMKMNKSTKLYLGQWWYVIKKSEKSEEMCVNHNTQNFESVFTEEQ